MDPVSGKDCGHVYSFVANVFPENSSRRSPSEEPLISDIKSNQNKQGTKILSGKNQRY